MWISHVSAASSWITATGSREKPMGGEATGRHLVQWGGTSSATTVSATVYVSAGETQFQGSDVTLPSFCCQETFARFMTVFLSDSHQCWR